MNLISSFNLLKKVYLEIVNDALKGKKLKTSEELAEEVIEKI